METLAVSRMIRRIGLGRSLIIQGTMDPLPIIENLDRGKDRLFGFLSTSTCRQVKRKARMRHCHTLSAISAGFRVRFGR